MKRIRLSEIVFDAGTQIRAAINESVVAEYAERMTEGVQFPPVVLFHDGNAYYMADGFHRGMAAQRNQFREIDADVQAGTKTDALWFALGANRANGQRLTDADKKHAVKLALSAWPDRSSTQLAQQVGCSTTYVQKIRSAEVPTGVNPVQRVVGADGVSYPASRDAREAARVEAERLLRQGKSVAEVRAEVGIGRDVAQQIKKDIGAGLDKSKAAVLQRRKDICDMAGRGFSTRQIASAIGITEPAVSEIAKKEGITIHADRVVGKTHRHDSNRIVSQMVLDAENLTADVHLIDFSALDRAHIAGWLASLKASRDKLGAFIRRLMQEQYGEAA